MKNKKILIAETHKEQIDFLKKALIRNNIPIEVIDVITDNSQEMKNAIIEYNPNIVITNELKKDRAATEIIKEIQWNNNIYQPIFIICSGYSANDIKLLCQEKAICAYSAPKPIDYDELAIEIGKISAEKTTTLDYYNYRKN